MQSVPMATITPHLWFDNEAKEAAAFYTSIFSRSRVKRTYTITGTPSGDCDIVSFELRGQPFEAISAGPYFKFNPSVSFIVNFDPSKEQNAQENIDRTWERLLAGGSVLMPLQEYPFAKRYGWLQDKYGLSWQLILTNPEGEERPEIIPSLLFAGERCGKAEEAVNFYTSVFKNSKKGALMHFDANQPPEREGTVMFADFKLQNMWMAAMDTAQENNSAFNEAVSFIVNCDTQSEIDYYWEKLSAVPEAEQCGWLKDKFGLSWQITPRALQEMMTNADRATLNRITQAFLKMKKFDIKELERAANAEAPEQNAKSAAGKETVKASAVKTMASERRKPEKPPIKRAKAKAKTAAKAKPKAAAKTKAKSKAMARPKKKAKPKAKTRARR